MPSVTPGIHNEWVRAWVVFDRSRRRYAWSAACGRWGHCWVYWSRFYPEPGLLSNEFTLKAEHTIGGIYCDIAFVPPADITAELLAATPAPLDLLHLDVLVQRSRMRYFGLLNCVTVVKAVLNLDAPWCLTPRQLHRRLVQTMGARSVMGEAA